MGVYDKQLSSEEIQRQIIETIKIIAESEAKQAVKEAINNIDINELMRKEMSKIGRHALL